MMELAFAEWELVLGVVGAKEPGRPPWKIVDVRPKGALRELSRARYATLDALVHDVRKVMTPRAHV